MIKATVLAESSIYFIFSHSSLCSSNVYRCESGRYHSLPFFLTFLSFLLSRFSFYINIMGIISIKNILTSSLMRHVYIQGVQGVTYTLAVELFPPRLRTVVGVVLEQYWATGLVYLAATSYYIPHWRNLQLAITLPTAVLVLYIL